jgi:dTDP-glucose 4,6-dehydratase
VAFQDLTPYDALIVDGLLVTGGAGFIGSNFVRLALERTSGPVVVLDKLTYAGNTESLDEVLNDPRMKFVQGDIGDSAQVDALLREERPASVVNFAAESHVDRSIDSPRPFIDTNIVGTFVMLEAARTYADGLSDDERSSFRFLHVSTDEVFGSLGPDGRFEETTPYAPNSPYAASKAAADHLVRAYFHTFELPTLLTNCSNNYGPYQFPEKLIPLMILNAIEGKPLPIYGDGLNVRDWIFVLDHCEGILAVLERGRPGESYNIGGDSERTNIEVVDAICDSLERSLPAASNERLRDRDATGYRDLKIFVDDRKGHDRRYAIDGSKMKRELGWSPGRGFDEGMEATVQWYLRNRDWCEKVQRKTTFNRERLGLEG